MNTIIVLLISSTAGGIGAYVMYNLFTAIDDITDMTLEEWADDYLSRHPEEASQ